MSRFGEEIKKVFKEAIEELVGVIKDVVKSAKSTSTEMFDSSFWEGFIFGMIMLFLVMAILVLFLLFAFILVFKMFPVFLGLLFFFGLALVFKANMNIAKEKERG